MTSEWREVQLAQVAVVISGKRPPVVVKDTSPDFSVPVIGGGGQSGFTNEALFDGEVLITGRVGTLGKLFAPNGPCWPSDNALVIRHRSPETHPSFLRYALQVVIAEAAGMNRGAANPLITQGDPGRLVIHHPPLPEQRAIAHILGTLDDKIELNRRINETLEAMARALFKSWFVDFDPVRAKAEGRDPGLPKPLADLFPDRFEDSELGVIPERWLVMRWGELVTLEYGKSLTGYDGEAGAYPVYGTNGKIGRHSRLLCEHPGIIIGRKGAYRGVHFCGEPFFVIDTAFYVEPRRPVELRWAYYELLLRQGINSMDSGSAIPSTSREDFYSLPVLSPPFELQQAFAGLLNPFWVRQTQGDQESRTLSPPCATCCCPSSSPASCG